ncbi:hypothetical protein K1719_031131 [Acacia pycnantha]|nr:hypothetical protein K1719_031131 [Acacia pycnantha]
MNWDPYPPCESYPCSNRQCCAGTYRYRWPELVGEDAEAATRVINKTNPGVTVVKIFENESTTCDFCCNRVRIIVQRSTNKVVSLPQVG